MEVFVTKLGIVSALGVGVEATWESILTEKTALAQDERLQLVLGRCPLTEEDLVAQMGEAVLASESRTSMLALLAAREAWNSFHDHPAIRTGLISGTSVGGMDLMEVEYWQAKERENFPDSLHPTSDNGLTTDFVAKNVGISGFITTISTACSSSANAIMQGARLIRAGMLDRVLVGGADPLITYNIKGFSSLKIYSPTPCSPFDAGRQGLNLGEGAAFLVLENEKSLLQSASQPLCQVSGWCNAADAYHQTASSPEGNGATRSMQGALDQAGISPEEVSYINAHGTGTPNNDLSESVALKRVFPHGVPPFGSTKAYTGHTLAAAGSIEAVLCVLAMQHQTLLPNLHFTAPMAETDLVPITRCQPAVSLKHILSNSFGFGGNCTSLIFSHLA